MFWPGFFNNQVAMTIIAEEIGRGDPQRLHVAQEDGEARGLNCLVSEVAQGKWCLGTLLRSP